MEPLPVSPSLLSATTNTPSFQAPVVAEGSPHPSTVIGICLSVEAQETNLGQGITPTLIDSFSR